MKGKGLYIVLGVLLLLVLWGGCGYNGMNTQSKDVDEKWANVQSQYQRRADLIPNLVKTTKGAAEFEKTTYYQVAKARGEALSGATKIDASQLTPAQIAKIQQASAEAQQANRMAVNVMFEQYPNLKSTELFQNVQVSLEGSENRISTARDKYNAAVKDYNIKVSNFPNNMLAGVFSFKQRASFEAAPGSDKAPEVDFSK